MLRMCALVEFVSLADPGIGDASLGPISFPFVQFSAKILLNNRLASFTSWAGVPCVGKPESAT